MPTVGTAASLVQTDNIQIKGHFMKTFPGIFRLLIKTKSFKYVILKNPKLHSLNGVFRFLLVLSPLGLMVERPEHPFKNGYKWSKTINNNIKKNLCQMTSPSRNTGDPVITGR